MANPTTNMGLTLPIVSLTLGPEWATLLNAALDQIDSHNHTAGQGRQVPTAGININADLGFANNSATLLKRIGFNSNASVLADINSVYVSGGDLWYTNATGSTVQITSGSSVNAAAGSISGLSGSTGSASFNNGSKEFSWVGDAGVFAGMNIGSAVLYSQKITTNKKVTLNAAQSMFADYNMYFPSAVPVGAGGFLMMRASGQQAYAYPDGTSIEENPTGTIKVKTITDSNLSDNTISGAKISDATITNSKLSSFFHYASNTAGDVYTPMPAGEVVYLTTTFTAPAGGMYAKISAQPNTKLTPPGGLDGFRATAYNTNAGERNFQMYIKMQKADGFTHYYTVRKLCPGLQTTSLEPMFVQDFVPAGSTTVSICFFSGANTDFNLTLQNMALLIVAP